MKNFSLTKVLSISILLGSALQAAPSFDVKFGASGGYQRGTGNISSHVKVVDPVTPTNDAYSLRKKNMKTENFVGDIFLEVGFFKYHNFNFALRPYFHFDNAKFKNQVKSDTSPDIFNTTLYRKNSYGLLLSPQFSIKQFSVYGLAGFEFGKFNAVIDQPLVQGRSSSSKTIPALVLGLGVEKEIAFLPKKPITVFSEYQYKKYRSTTSTQVYKPEPTQTNTESVKFSPSYHSIMVGFKFTGFTCDLFK